MLTSMLQTNVSEARLPESHDTSTMLYLPHLPSHNLCHTLAYTSCP